MFSSKQIVTMVVAASAAVVLAPVGVMAATGQLVNLADPVLDRKARVGSGGSLQVETRPGVTSGAVNVNHPDLQTIAPRLLMQATSPTRIAVSEVTVGVRKASGGTPVDAPTVFEINRYVHVSGSNPCGGTGWTPLVLRRVTLKTDQTLHLKFDGPPLIVPAPAPGTRYCVAAKLWQYVGYTYVDVGATVFTYS